MLSIFHNFIITKRIFILSLQSNIHKRKTMKEKKFSIFADMQKKETKNPPNFGRTCPELSGLPFVQYTIQGFAIAKERNFKAAKSNSIKIKNNPLNHFFMNLKTKSTFILLAIAMFMKINFAFSQDLKNQKLIITNVIESSMMLFLDEIPDELLVNYGIKDKAEIKKATIGNPIAVYTIEKDSLLFTRTWRIPLIIDSEYRALFTIFKNIDNEYKIVDFGAILLAKEFFNFSKENDFVAILRVYELRKDYFISKNIKGEYKLHPIPNPENTQYSLDDLIRIIK